MSASDSDNPQAIQGALAKGANESPAVPDNGNALGALKEYFLEVFKLAAPLSRNFVLRRLKDGPDLYKPSIDFDGKLVVREENGIVFFITPIGTFDFGAADVDVNRLKGAGFQPTDQYKGLVITGGSFATDSRVDYVGQLTQPLLPRPMQIENRRFGHQGLSALWAVIKPDSEVIKRLMENIPPVAAPEDPTVLGPLIPKGLPDRK